MNSARFVVKASLGLCALLLVFAAAGPQKVEALASFNPANVKLTEVASGLTRPLSIANAGDGTDRLFIVEQAGTIKILQAGALLGTPFLNIGARVKDDTAERGLLGLAFDPDYATNGYFYVSYTSEPSGDLTLSRFTVSGGNANLGDDTSELILKTVPHPNCTNHNGGSLAFGPVDGYLYWSTGDGGGNNASPYFCGGDGPGNAQNLNSLLGKILRLDVDASAPYLPASNPFVETPADNPNTLGEIWAYGLRNPWRISFDRSTHDLYIGDVGQGVREEIDVQLAASSGGLNYGWNIMEGTTCFNLANFGSPLGACDTTNKVLPVTEYDHSLGCSVTGGYVYRGTRYLPMQGYYFYGDYCSGRIWALSGTTSTLVLDTTYNISSFGEDEGGELYFTALGQGKVVRLRYAPGAADFDGNGVSDVVVFRGGAWNRYDFNTGNLAGSTWTGNPGGSCIPAPMDYEGDGTKDFTLLCGGAWHFYNDDGSYNKGIWVGNAAGQLPVPADYDDNGTEDVMVFRGGAWLAYDFTTGAYLPGSSVWTGFPSGAGTPVPMDYNRDGRADRTILSANGAWHFYNANGTYNKGIWIGNVAGQAAVPGDYNGDGADEVVVYRAGAWLFYDFATGAYLPGSSVWTGNPAAGGSGSPKPAPIDYNGDGKLDLAFYNGGPWRFFNANGSLNKTIATGGVAGDLAISRRHLP